MTRHCPDCGAELGSKEVEGRERGYCGNCSEIIWQNPKPVAWVLAENRGRYLLVKRAQEPDKGDWDIPGGFLELEESFREAGTREMEEETGLEVRAEDLEFLETLSFERAGDHVAGIVFRIEVEEEPELEPGTEAEDAGFWKPAELEENGETIRDVCRELIVGEKQPENI